MLSRRVLKRVQREREREKKSESPFASLTSHTTDIGRLFPFSIAVPHAKVIICIVTQYATARALLLFNNTLLLLLLLIIITATTTLQQQQ